MLKELFDTTGELTPIEADPAVAEAMQELAAARGRLDQLEIAERRMIALVTGKLDGYRDEELEQATQTLSIRKGSQSGWYSGEADAQRQTVKQLTLALQEVVEPAKERLVAAGTAKIAHLTKQLYEAVKVAQRAARDIADVQQQISDGGVRPPEHPCSCLLPGQTAEFQLRIAKMKGWI